MKSVNNNTEKNNFSIKYFILVRNEIQRKIKFPMDRNTLTL